MAQSFLAVLISLASNSKIFLCFPLRFLHLAPAWRCLFSSPMARTCLSLLSPVPQPFCPLLWVSLSSRGAWAVPPPSEPPRTSQTPAAPGSIQPQAGPCHPNPCSPLSVQSDQFLIDPSGPLCFLPSSAAALSWSCPCPSLHPLPLECDPFLQRLQLGPSSCWKSSVNLISNTSGSVESLYLLLFLSWRLFGILKPHPDYSGANLLRVVFTCRNLPAAKEGGRTIALGKITQNLRGFSFPEEAGSSSACKLLPW